LRGQNRTEKWFFRSKAERIARRKGQADARKMEWVKIAGGRGTRRQKAKKNLQEAQRITRKKRGPRPVIPARLVPCRTSAFFQITSTPTE
jgi:hypothetical protein